jgi:hypothetical protein
MFFIELLHVGQVTVNGHTYINVDVEAGAENAAILPFFIGPLNRYTIIELLSQPIFFFPSSNDLNFTDVPKGGSAIPSTEELRRRDGHGHIHGGNVENTWRPLDPQSRPPISVNKTVDTVIAAQSVL